MENEWIRVAYIGDSWSNITVYVNPIAGTAKVFRSKISHWGYHDESEWDESEEIITVEQALALVYPDKNAISLILSSTGKNDTDTLKRLEENARK